MLKKRIAFLGVGNMAAALIRGIIEVELTKPEAIIISDINKEKLKMKNEKLKVKAAEDNGQAIIEAEVIILAVKPKDIEGLLAEIKDSLEPKKLVISIAAGITTSYIEKILKKEIPVIPVLVKNGVMPDEDDLPEGLKPLAYRNAIPIPEEPFFHNGVDLLIKEMAKTFSLKDPIKQPGRMGYCIYCGNEVMPGNKFCIHCGKPV